VFAKYWHPEMVIQHILERSGAEPLNAYYYATHYPSVHAAAVRIWGTWKDAIEACGLDYGTIRKYRVWSDERVVEEIIELSKKHYPLASKFAQSIHKPLYMAAVRRFGSWSKALRKAGIDNKRVRLRRARTPDEIREEILALYRNQVSLAYPYMREHHSDLLAAGMKKLGDGSWQRARLVCGIEDNYRAIGQASAVR